MISEGSAYVTALHDMIGHVQELKIACVAANTLRVKYLRLQPKIRPLSLRLTFVRQPS